MFVAMLLLAVGYLYYSSELDVPRSIANRTSASTGTATLNIDSNVKAATVSIDGTIVASSLPATVPGVAVGRELKIIIFSNGYKKFEQKMSLSAGDARTINAMLVREDSSAAGSSVTSVSPTATSTGQISLKINIRPIGVGNVITLNGAVVDAAGVAMAPLDTPLSLVIEREGFRTVHRTLTISSDTVRGLNEYAIDVNLESAKFGFVSIKTTPSADAYIVIDGVEEHWSTPVSRKRVPVGSYKVRLVNQLLGMEKEVDFTVSEDRFVNIDERLRVPASN
jgi:hypothetical protein